MESNRIMDGAVRIFIMHAIDQYVSIRGARDIYDIDIDVQAGLISDALVKLVSGGFLKRRAVRISISVAEDKFYPYNQEFVTNPKGNVEYIESVEIKDTRYELIYLVGKALAYYTYLSGVTELVESDISRFCDVVGARFVDIFNVVCEGIEAGGSVELVMGMVSKVYGLIPRLSASKKRRV